jgi:hypothetical protein
MYATVGLAAALELASSPLLKRLFEEWYGFAL